MRDIFKHKIDQFPGDPHGPHLKTHQHPLRLTSPRTFLFIRENLFATVKPLGNSDSIQMLGTH